MPIPARRLPPPSPALVQRLLLAALVSLFLLGCSQRDKVHPSRQRSSPSQLATTGTYEQHIQALRPKIPPGFTVVVQHPFVVLGDEPEATVRRRSQTLVKWAVDALKAEYFERDPDPIVDIWLFRDDESYRNHTLAIYGRRPTTRFGFYSDKDNALLMNIGTGGGTLVHEVVHAFMRSNFPQCPVWFNEGLGSLYEASEDDNGHPKGLLNWRLPGLQEALRDDRVPSFKDLTSMDDDTFYGSGSGVNYALARYLLFYLQEQGKLKSLWLELRASFKTDPTGYSSLRKVLGDPDMVVFEQKWKRWALGLHWSRGA